MVLFGLLGSHHADQANVQTMLENLQRAEQNSELERTGQVSDAELFRTDTLRHDKPQDCRLVNQSWVNHVFKHTVYRRDRLRPRKRFSAISLPF